MSIQTYSGILSTLCNLHIFTTLPYSEPWHLELEAYSKPCQILTIHIKKLSIVRAVYRTIIQRYSGIFKTLCNACICRNILYTGIFRTLPYLLLDAEPCHIYENRSTMCNNGDSEPCHSEAWNIQNLDTFKTWHIFITL